jgi:hypothetical protein
MTDLSLRNLVGQISRQFEILKGHVDGHFVYAMEGEDVRLMTEGQQDVLFIPCELSVTEPVNLMEGLSVEIGEKGGQIHFIIRMESSYREIFIPFIADVILRLETLGMPSAFDETLEDWRVLWAGERGRLNRSQQRGLLGELHVLSRIIDCSTDAANSWVGPLRELHDFMADTLHLEVKTTNRQPPSVRISNIAQVAPLHGDAQLALVVVGLESGDEISLPESVDWVRNKIGDGDNRLHFEKVLRRSGYRDEHGQHYRSMYAIAFQDIHWITESSPVIDPMLLGELPATVRDITYTLDVFAMDMEPISDQDWSRFADQLKEAGST